MSSKITIIGAGSVGSTIAYTLSSQDIASEIVLIDINKKKAEGEVLDIIQGTCFRDPINIKAGEYEDAKDSNIVIITSGIARKPGQTRIELAQTNVNILKETTTLRELIFTFKYIAAFKRLLSIVLCKRITSLEKRWRLFWKLNKKSFRPNSKKYDCAISYNDGVELYYMVDCLCANVKIAWNHTNYTNSFTYKPTLDKFYYDRVNYIVTISEECAYTLKRVFPENADKVRIIENIVLKDTLMSLASNPQLRA